MMQCIKKEIVIPLRTKENIGNQQPRYREFANKETKVRNEFSLGVFTNDLTKRKFLTPDSFNLSIL